MYSKYYVNDNAQSTGEHEVHKEGCSYLDSIKSKTYLGEFTNCRDALKKAREFYTNVDGGKCCIPECHSK